MNGHRRLAVTCLATAAVAALWVLLLFLPETNRPQLSCFIFFGDAPMLDWNFIRYAADFPDAYSNANLPEACPGLGPIPRADVCNPALAMLLVRLLPSAFAWGVAVTVTGTLLYLLAAALYFRRRTGVASPWVAGTLLATFPFFAAFVVGNVILYAAAAGLVFLALYDSDSRSERVIAALALAFAFAVKISPAVLGVLYFAYWRRHWPYALVSAFAAVLMLLVPFAVYGGVEGFGNWFACAAANSAAYESRNVIGLYGVFYTLGMMLGRYAEWYPSGHVPVHALSAVLALAALASAAWGRRSPVERTFLATAGMVMLPPTMMVYTLLFVLPPVLALPSRRSALAFVALACPLQVFVAGHSLQPLVASAAFLLLVLVTLFVRHGDVADEWAKKEKEAQ